MSESEYNLYSAFNVEKHREKYPHYLEVIIDRNGNVLYAVPSHQEKAIEILCQEKGWTREELKQNCPRERYFDFMDWLLELTGALSVWTGFYKGHPTDIQIKKLNDLKSAGVYEGEV